VFIFLHQGFLIFDTVRVFWNAVHRAYFYALWLIEMAHTLGAAIRINFIDLIAHRNGVIGALWLANITIDAFISNN
jgi:hypothetical protein